MPPRFQGRADRLPDFGLVLVENRSAVGAGELGLARHGIEEPGRQPLDPLVEFPQQAFGDQPRDHRHADADGLGEFVLFERRADAAEVVEHLLLLRRHARQNRRLLVAREQFDDGRIPRPGIPAHPGGDDGVQHLPPAAEVVVRHPAGELQEFLVEQRDFVEHLANRFDFPRWQHFRDADDVADGEPLAAAERTLDALAHGDGVAEVLRDRVAVRGVQRSVENDIREQRRRGGGTFHPVTLPQPAAAGQCPLVGEVASRPRQRSEETPRGK